MLPSRFVSAMQKASACDDETLPDTGGPTNGAPDVAAPHLLVALECDRPAAGIARHSLANIDRIEIGHGATRGAERIFDTAREIRNSKGTNPHFRGERAPARTAQNDVEDQ